MSKLIKLAEKKNNLLLECSLDSNYIYQPSSSSSSPANNDLCFHIQHIKASFFSESIKEKIFEIFELNMKEMYLNSSWGWNKDELFEEFFSLKSNYLLLFQTDRPCDENEIDRNNLQAYIHFQVKNSFFYFLFDFSLSFLTISNLLVYLG